MSRKCGVSVRMISIGSTQNESNWKNSKQINRFNQFDESIKPRENSLKTPNKPKTVDSIRQ